jgi:hypothetical protein
MKNTIIYRYLALSLPLFAGLTACKDNIHDFGKKYPSIPSNYIYIADADKEFTYDLFQDVNGGSGVDTVLVKFPVNLTSPALSETKVTIDVDEYLNNIYNEGHGTKYERPETAISNSTLTVPQGATRSSDSVVVRLAKPMKDLKSERGYLISLKIRNFEGTDVGIDYARRQSHVIFKVKLQNTVNSVDDIYINAAHESIGSVKFSLPSILPVQGDEGATVGLTVENSHVAEYNAANGTNYLPIESDLTSSYSVSITSGASMSDPISLNYTGDQSTLNDPKGYLIPVEISSVTGLNIAVPTKRKVIYFVLFSNIVTYVGDGSSITATKITDRTGYSVPRFVHANGDTPTVRQGKAENLVGDDGVIVNPMPSPLNATIDLGKDVANIKGIQIVSLANENSGATLRALDLSYASNEMYRDGKSRSLRNGIDLSTATPNRRKTVAFEFEKPVTARYLYLNNMDRYSMGTLSIDDIFIYTE